jgi:tRNA (cytidine/uridine-2'-O-)-methyltransferase
MSPGDVMEATPLQPTHRDDWLTIAIMTFDVVLYEPEIPPNTGNIIRICANTGARLHLVEPLGFEWEDTRLKRAGLDYHEYASVRRHSDLESFTSSVAPRRTFAFSTKGTTRYTDIEFESGDALLFGPESRGLPDQVLASMPSGRTLRIPMLAHSRSVNLANAVAVVLYEAWRQHGFSEGA